MRLFEELNRPRTVLLVLAIIIAVNGFLLYRYLAAPSESSSGAAPGDVRTPDSVEESADTADGAATPQTTETDYLVQIGNIQDGAVESILRSNDKLLRYDTLTPDDVADLQTNYSSLEDYSDQIENLDPPEEYRGHYALFESAVADLYVAAEIAYRLAADPVSASKDDFDEYERRIDDAIPVLRQSNEMLGQNFDTIEGLRYPSGQL